MAFFLVLLRYLDPYHLTNGPSFNSNSAACAYGCGDASSITWVHRIRVDPSSAPATRMDPATIIAVSELSVKILSLISQYYSDVKHAKRDIERLESEIQSLHAVFKKVQELIQKSSLAPKFQTSASLIRTTEQALIDVTGLERQLEHEIGAKPMSRVGKSALKWPFAKKEVNEWVAKLERHKTSLDLALTTDQRYNSPLSQV